METTINERSQVKRKEVTEEEDQKFFRTRFAPKADVTETGEAVYVYMDMPGVKKENLTINLENLVLSIEGRLERKNFGEFNPYYTEYKVGSYGRSFKLSTEIDRDNIEAKILDGVLTLTLPKLPHVKPREISIQ